MQKFYQSKIYALANLNDKSLFKKVAGYLKPDVNDKILEVGCGRGFLTNRMQKICKDTIGVDINAEAVAAGMCDNLFAMDATRLEFPDNSFDKVYSCHTIEHIIDIKGALSEMERVLKPGGKILLVYPAELFRGMGAIGTALFIFKNPFLCRKIHVHKLCPKKIKELVQGSLLKCLKSWFSLFRTSQYFTLLEKSV